MSPHGEIDLHVIRGLGVDCNGKSQPGKVVAFCVVQVHPREAPDDVLVKLKKVGKAEETVTAETRTMVVGCWRRRVFGVCVISTAEQWRSHTVFGFCKLDGREAEQECKVERVEWLGCRSGQACRPRRDIPPNDSICPTACTNIRTSTKLFPICCRPQIAHSLCKTRRPGATVAASFPER